MGIDYSEVSVWELVARIQRYCKRANEFYQETGELDCDSYRAMEELAREINRRGRNKEKEWADK